MSSSDSIDAPPDDDPGNHPEPTIATDIDPAIAEAVDGVANRFGVQGLEEMLAYGEKALANAREALAQLSDG